MSIASSVKCLVSKPKDLRSICLNLQPNDGKADGDKQIPGTPRSESLGF